MGKLEGHEQHQIYVRMGLWPLMVVLAQKLGKPVYKVVNAAFWEKLQRHFSKEELKALQDLMEKPDGRNKGK